MAEAAGRDYEEQYEAGVVQCVTRIVEGRADKDRVIRENTARDIELIDYFFGDRRYTMTKLVVFPEFFLTSVPESRSHEDYLLRSIELPGEYTEPFAAAARRHGIYIAGNCFELDREWPGRCFNTSWIIDPQGEMILKYRKLNGTQIGISTNTNPGDMYAAYVERYGRDALFPVVDTPIGRLACLTCYDVNFPEVARCLALKGAEVLLMPTGDGYYFAREHRLMKQARCYENSCYLVTATHGEFVGRRPRFVQRGYSEIIDMNGNPVRTIDGPGECTLTGLVDLRALRLKRSRPGYFNFIVGLRSSLYAQVYAEAPTWPLDTWGEEIMQSNAEAHAKGREILEELYARGVFARP